MSNNQPRPEIGWIQPVTLVRLATELPNVTKASIQEALILAAKEIAHERGYIDQLHAQLGIT